MARYGEGFGSDYRTDDNRDRWREDDRERSNWRSGGEGSSERDDERGFFQRAGDEIRSWFNEDDDRSERGYGRDYEREGMGERSWEREGSNRSGRPSGGSWDRDRSGGFSDRNRERSPGRTIGGGYNSMNEGRGQFGNRRQGGQFGRQSGNWDRDRERGFGPSSGSDRDRFGSSNRGFGGFRDESDFRGRQHRDHPQSLGEANRGENESLGYGEFSGTLGGFGNQTFGSSEHDHYRNWRDRELAKLDRDYGDYCREREHQFNQDFDSWRRNRQSQSPSAASNAPSADLGAASNAGVGTTTSSMTGTAGAGSEMGSATTQSGSMQTGRTASAETSDAGTGSSRSGSRSRS